MFNARVRLTGDWNDVSRRLNRLKQVQAQGNQIMMEVGDLVAGLISKVIENNEIPLEALDVEYASQKRADGYGGNILVRTSDYVNSFHIERVIPEADGIRVFVSVPNTMTETGITMKELAYYHEYGTKTMPGRRPIGKAWEHIKPDIEDILEKQFKDILRRAISK